MSTDKIANDLSAILPDQNSSINGSLGTSRSDLVAKQAEGIARQKTARELAALKSEEKRRLRKQEERLQVGIPDGQTVHQHKALEEQRQKIEVLETLEEQNSGIASVVQSSLPTGRKTAQALALQGPSRTEIAKLMTELNINLDIKLTRNDTANLLASLLTCNESQLQALMNNKKLPIAIKIVIKRLQEDAKLGSMGALELIWDRVFGKASMIMDLPQQQQEMTGILPNMPVSREAYIVIRDTMIK